MTAPDLRAGLIALRDEIFSSSGSDPSFDANRTLKKAWVGRLDALIAASPGVRVVECGAHAYTPDATGDCTGCGGGPGSHWGHTARASPGAHHEEVLKQEDVAIAAVPDDLQERCARVAKRMGSYRSDRTARPEMTDAQHARAALMRAGFVAVPLSDAERQPDPDHFASPGAPDAGGRVEDFLRELGSLSDRSIAEADPALLSSYRDDARDLYDALAAAPPQGRDQLREYVQHKQGCGGSCTECGVAPNAVGELWHQKACSEWSASPTLEACSCGLAARLVGEPSPKDQNDDEKTDARQANS